jgi:hypothetical protein
MKRHLKWLAHAIAVASTVAFYGSAPAETVISTFDDNFSLDGLFAWASAVVAATSTNYSVTFSGYGSGYKRLDPVIDASGETIIKLTVTLSAPGAGPKDPISGPIVSLVDGDGTFYNYAWYGQTIGTHVLTAPLKAPTSVSAAGTVSGLDLSSLAFFHLQDDPGAYQGEYTISFEDLRLVGAPGPTITAPSYNRQTREFTLTWTSKAGASYTVQYTANLATPFADWATDIASQGAQTSTTVTIPAGAAGFLRLKQQ